MTDEEILKGEVSKDIYTDISQFTHFPDWAIQRVLSKLDNFTSTKVIFVAPKGMFIRGKWDVPMFDSAGINMNELRAFALLHGFSLPRHMGVAV